MSSPENESVITNNQPLVIIEMGAGTLDGQSLIDMNNLICGYLVPVYEVGKLKYTQEQG